VLEVPLLEAPTRQSPSVSHLLLSLLPNAFLLSLALAKSVDAALLIGVVLPSLKACRAVKAIILFSLLLLQLVLLMPGLLFSLPLHLLLLFKLLLLNLSLLSLILLLPGLPLSLPLHLLLL
jgi:hypothetical protein